MKQSQSGTYPHLTSRLPLLLLILAVLLPTATGNTLVKVQLNNYTNSDNTKDQDDRYCDETNKTPCNILFDVKLKLPVKFSFKTAPTKEKTEKIIFTDTITADDGSTIPNPFPGSVEEQTFTKGIKELRFGLNLWHVNELGEKSKVAGINYRRWFDSWGPKTEALESGYSTLTLTTFIECAPDYYRRPLPPLSEQNLEVSNCTYCVETDKYTCNKEDGSKICKPGWEGANCDTAVPENCPAIEEANSTITPSTYKKDSLVVGYTLTFSCPGPYLSYLSGSPFMTCQNSGKWNSTVPSCIPVVDNIDKKMNTLRNTGLYILAGVLVVFSSAVTVMTYVTSYMAISNTSNISNVDSSKPTCDENFESVGETGFESEYTDKTYLVGDAAPGAKQGVGPNSQQIKVNLNNLKLVLEDVDF